MNLSRKLRAVIRHEFLTIVKQPSFWISLFAVPLLLGLIVLIGYFTDSSDNKDIAQSKELSIAVVDEARIIEPAAAEPYGLAFRESNLQPALHEDVKSGEIDGLIVFPASLMEDGQYRIFADNTDQDNAALLSELGRTLLQQSLLSALEEHQAALALSGGEGVVQAYKHGEPTREFVEIIVPGTFLILFYIILVFSVGYALTSISEEKENRSIEMVLSYVKPRTLIRGKLLAIILVTLLQLAVIGTVALAAYFVARSLGNSLSLPFSVSDLTFVPFEVFIGISFLVFGFIFYVALMAMVGAIFPSSKEASGFSTVFFLLPAVPFWGMDAITSQAASSFTQILTYFPLTSPTTVLLRNAAGNLGAAEGLVALALLMFATVAAVYLAAKAFRLGTLEYTSRIKFSALLKK